MEEIFLENRNFLTWIHDPQISNQIDAADYHHYYDYNGSLTLATTTMMMSKYNIVLFQ